MGIEMTLNEREHRAFDTRPHSGASGRSSQEMIGLITIRKQRIHLSRSWGCRSMAIRASCLTASDFRAMIVAQPRADG